MDICDSMRWAALRFESGTDLSPIVAPGPAPQAGLAGNFHTPRNARLQRILQAVLLGLVVCYVAALTLEIMVLPLDGFDESIQVLGAKAVGAGLLPHADFWTDYPALNYWIIAAAFKVFGAHYLVSRLVSFCFYVAVLATAWLTAPNRTSRMWMVVGLALSIGKFYYYSPWNALACVLIVLLLLCWRRDDTSLSFWATIGVLLALCLLIRINFAGYALVAGAASILLARSVSMPRKLATLVSFVAPACCSAALYCVMLRHNLAAVYAQVIDFPAHILMKERILETSPTSVGLFLVPLLLVGWHVVRHRKELVFYGAFLLVVAATFLIDLHRHSGIPRPMFAVWVALALIVIQALSGRLGDSEFVILVCYFLFLHYYLARADQFHLWPALVVLGLLAWLKAGKRPLLGRDYLDLALLLGVAILGLSLHARGSMHMLVPSPWLFSPYSLERLTPAGHRDMRIEVGLRSDGLADALEYLLSNTSSSDYVYSGLQDHSRGFVNNMGVYVILNRPIPVSDWEYEPGLSSEDPAQRAVINELRRTHTRWLLLWKGLPSKDLAGSHLLDSFIVANFCPRETFGNYQVWHRCDDSRP